MEKSQTLEDLPQDGVRRVQSKRSLDTSNTSQIYDAELGSSNPSKYAYNLFNTFREIHVDIGTRVRLNEKERHSILQKKEKSVQYSYDGDNWYDFYEGASGQISLVEFNYTEPVPDSLWIETDSDHLAIKGFVIPPKTMWIRVKTEYSDYYKFQHVLKINVKNSLSKDFNTKFGSTGTKNPVDMGNTEKNISIIAGQTISFQGGYTAGTDILDVKYILNGKEYSGHTKDHKNFSFGPMGHVGFLDKGHVRYRYSEMLGEFTPSYFPPDGNIQLEVLSKYFRKKVSHKLNIEVRILKEIVIQNDPSWTNITLPENATYFYIPVKATGPDQMQVQWYYQPHNGKDWVKIEKSTALNSSSDPAIQGLMFSGFTQNTLLVGGSLNEPPNSQNGLKFRAVFSDEVREISKTSQTTKINFSKELEYSISPIGYRVVNGKIDSTQELTLDGINLIMPHSPYLAHHAKPNPGSIGKQDTILRNSRGIIGTDDRIQVKDPTYFPYRAIGSLEVRLKHTDAQGKLVMVKGYSTAWLVSKDTAVTVGHTLFDYGTKSFVEDIKFRTFWKNGSFQHEADVEEVWLDKNFLKVNSSFIDWGILKLKKPRGKNKHIGEELGWLGYESHPGIHAYDHLSLSTVHAKSSGTYLLSHGKILRSTPNSLFTNLDTDFGSSGAPFLIGENSAIAINVGVPDINALGKENDTCRITPELFNVISRIKDK